MSTSNNDFLSNWNVTRIFLGPLTFSNESLEVMVHFVGLQTVKIERHPFHGKQLEVTSSIIARDSWATLSRNAKQGCQMVSFRTKKPNLGKFWRALHRRGKVDIFEGHLEYFTDFGDIL
jgi:hypothetical protein